MDNVERDDVSNSQNDNFVERIIRGADGRCVVHLRNGPSFFVSDLDLLDIELIEGSIATPEALAHLSRSASVREVEAKALELLARREHSRAQLTQKLIKRRYDRSIIDEVSEDFESRGFLDDFRFACLWIDQRVRGHSEGLLKLRAGLNRAGISRRVIDEAIDESLPESYEDEAFERSVANLEASGRKSVESIVRRLHSLGFSSTKIRSYVESRDTP